MDRVWNEDGAVLTVDCGDLFGHRNKNEEYQTRFLCEVTGDFGLDAIGLGEKDLNYGLGFLREMIQKYELPFTSANVRLAETGELILPEYIKTTKNGMKIGICSVLASDYKIVTMDTENTEFIIDDPVATLRELLPRMRKEVDTVILLAHVGDEGVKSLLQEVSGVDLAVTGHSYRSLNTEKLINETPVVCSVHEGRYVGRANLFIDEKTGQIKAFDVTNTSLDDAIPDDEDMAARVAAFKESLQDFKVTARAAYPQNKGSDKEQYLSAYSCKGCHTEAWQVYAQSGHKKAFSTIRTKGRNFDPECLVCHTTGYEYKNGYSDERPFNRLTDVQCEACHGYGTEHARDGKWLAQAKDSCIVCHDKKNSPDFDYATYWEKIKH